MFPPITDTGAFRQEIATQINGQFATLQGASFVGGTTQVLPTDGNLNVQISSAGISPGATGADNVLAVFSIPAGSFSAAGKMVTITANGSFANNGDTKTVKIIFNPATAVVGSTVGTGGTTIASTGAITTANAGWQLSAAVTKYGAAASNTQLGVNLQNQTGATAVAILVPQAITATESGAILIAITGNAATTATDILFNMLQVRFAN